MPNVSGWELQARIAASGRQIPIVFITAYPDEAVCTKVMKAGAVDYLVKPFNESELVSSIQLALARNRWVDLWDA
jgi:FixJ family two-component response regulator